MRWFILLSCLVLAACGRPLTSNEQAFLQATHGNDLDTGRIRIVDGNLSKPIVYKIPARPRTTCQERIWPPIEEGTMMEVSPAAITVFNRLLYRKTLYAPDLMEGWPHEVDLTAAMLFAHEATHVWQWQNRRHTGYSPLKAMGEHAAHQDPYLFDPDTEGRFLDYGYEQQASLVEEYVCCRLLDPEAARTTRLREMIAQEMPISGLDDAVDRPRIRLPWSGVTPAGICE